MKRKLLAMAISLLLIFSTLPGMAIGASVKLNLNTGSAKVGDVVTASGIADPNEWVSIKVMDSSKNIVFFDVVKSNFSGEYSCQFKVPEVLPGTLMVVAGYGNNVANQTLTVGEEIPAVLENIAITKQPNKLIYTIGEELEITGLVVTGTYSDGSTRIETVTKSNITGFNNQTIGSQTLTININGKTAYFKVTVTKAEEAQQDKIITITDEPVTITVPANIRGAKIEVKQNEPLPLVAVRAETFLGKVEMEIPEGVEITNAPANWDGTITLPEVKDQPSTTVSNAAQVSAVIEVGLPDQEITFDKPVRLLIPGQKGKAAGYIRNGIFTAITTSISQDNAETADYELAQKGARDGKVDSGNNLAIWTKHFTEFIAYTPSSAGSPSGGGGGSVPEKMVTSTTGKAIVKPSVGGKISLGDNAKIEIPAGALKGNNEVEVKIVKVSTTPTVPVDTKLASEVFEFTIGNNSSYSFAKPVVITLTFDPKLVDENDTVAIHYYDEKSEKWVNIGGTISGNIISVKVDHFTKFAVLGIPKAEKEPEDVPATGETLITLTDINGHWAETNINKLVNMKAISGYPDSTFRPNNSITRAEFATVLVKAFKLTPKDGKIFTDTANHWAKDYIATANAHNIVSGYSDTNFGPDDVITREQMAVMIVNAAKLNNTTTDKTFADESQISEWAKDAVAKASGAGIITGYPDNTFRPKANATRAEAVTVIVRGM